jgi:hypothetical protein
MAEVKDGDAVGDVVRTDFEVCPARRSKQKFTPKEPPSWDHVSNPNWDRSRPESVEVGNLTSVQHLGRPDWLICDSQTRGRRLQQHDWKRVPCLERTMVNCPRTGRGSILISPTRRQPCRPFRRGLNLASMQLACQLPLTSAVRLQVQRLSKAAARETE